MRNLRGYALLLGGDVTGGQIVFPPPGHTKRDRSAILKFVEGAPDGFLIHSFAGDDPLPIRDYVKERLGLTSAKPMRMLLPSSRPIPASEDKGQVARALAIWHEARDPGDTPVEFYLRRRGLVLPDEAAGEAIRFHPSCPFAKSQTPAMVCLVRDVVTNAPKAIHRTAISRKGQKVNVAGFDRLSLGSIHNGAIKLTPDENVTICLGVSEGVENALSLRAIDRFGTSPIWSLISASGLRSLPVLAGIEALWVAVDHDLAGISAARPMAKRWLTSGAEAFLVTPSAAGEDLNDVLMLGQPDVHS
jgi:putative DNA primase/helicase